MPTYHYSAISVFLLCAGLLCLWLATQALGQRRHAFNRAYAMLMVASALYAFGYAMELASPDLAQMKSMLRIQYLGIPFIPLAWIALAWAYLDPRGLPVGILRFLFATSFAVFLAYQTNDQHQLYYTHLAYSRWGDLAIPDIGKGPLYWLTIAYLNLSSLIGVALFFRAWRQSRKLYRNQACYLLLGSLFPWFFHLLYQTGLSPHNLDLAPFGLAGSGVMFALASLRHGVLDVLPTARDLVFDAIAEAVLVIDERCHLVDFNRAAKSFLPGLNEASVGLPLTEAGGAVLPVSKLQAGGRFEIEVGQGEGIRFFEVNCHAMADRRGNVVFRTVVALDVTEKKRLTDRLQVWAAYDELTNVFNRRHLMALSRRETRLAARHERPLAVIIIDVDHFKAVNDAGGHSAGDDLLRRIAAMLAARIRSTDILGRYGGDEFVVTLPGANAASALHLARELNAACQQECANSLSLGVAELRPGDEDFDSLLRRADAALYRAKREGRGQARLFILPEVMTAGLAEAETGC